MKSSNVLAEGESFGLDLAPLRLSAPLPPSHRLQRGNPGPAREGPGHRHRLALPPGISTHHNPNRRGTCRPHTRDAGEGCSGSGRPLNPSTATHVQRRFPLALGITTLCVLRNGKFSKLLFITMMLHPGGCKPGPSPAQSSCVSVSPSSQKSKWLTEARFTSLPSPGNICP